MGRDGYRAPYNITTSSSAAPQVGVMAPYNVHSASPTAASAAGSAGTSGSAPMHTNMSFFAGFPGFGGSNQQKNTPTPTYQTTTSTDMNLVRVASTDGNSTNQRYSTVTGSSSMWAVRAVSPVSCLCLVHVSHACISRLCTCVVRVDVAWRCTIVTLAKSRPWYASWRWDQQSDSTARDGRGVGSTG